MSRLLTYAQAINEALFQMMRDKTNVILMGQGVTSPWYVGGTCDGLLDTFGPDRVIDTPISENAMTGAAVGLAMMGMRPIICFPRHDFMLYAMDPIINHAAKIHYMFGGRAKVPMVIWAILNPGGSQGAQHSQNFEWLFENIPGLKSIKPTNALEAKGAMISAILDDNPVVFMDDRRLYDKVWHVPEYAYTAGSDLLPEFDLYEPGGCPVPASPPLEGAWEREYGS